MSLMDMVSATFVACGIVIVVWSVNGLALMITPLTSFGAANAAEFAAAAAEKLLID